MQVHMGHMKMYNMQALKQVSKHFQELATYKIHSPSVTKSLNRNQ